MKKLAKIILPMILAAVIVTLGVTSSVSAMTLKEGAEAARCDGCPSNLFGETGIFRQITSTILYIAVIMLIWGGIRYVVSGGDAKKVTDAKNTVLYAIIGLIVAFLAFAIVNFVVNALPSDKTEENKNEDTALIVDYRG